VLKPTERALYGGAASGRFAVNSLSNPLAATGLRSETERTKLRLSGVFVEAGDGARTHDPQLGKLMLYQLSYARVGRILA
jgi:hypothetical protein